jgi:hypothetical protein
VLRVAMNKKGKLCPQFEPDFKRTSFITYITALDWAKFKGNTVAVAYLESLQPAH